ELAQLHPEHAILVAALEGDDDLLEVLEAFLRSVGVEAGPVAEHHGRVAAFDELDHAAARRILVRVAMALTRDVSVPAAVPVARSRGHVDDEAYIVGSQALDVLDSRPSAFAAFGDVLEIVRDLGLEDVPHRLAHRERKLRLHRASETARRRDSLARKLAVLEDPERVREIARELVDRSLLLRVGVLHRARRDLLERPPGREVDHPGMGDHLRVDVPAREQELADKLQALEELPARPAGKLAVEPADAGRIGDDAILSLHPVLAAPLPELAHEIVGDLAG